LPGERWFLASKAGKGLHLSSDLSLDHIVTETRA
jgi:hypothetical protein